MPATRTSRRGRSPRFGDAPTHLIVGGTRRYSRREIDQLREIAALVSEGLNLAGVRRVLNLERQIRELQADVSRLGELQREVTRLRSALAKGQ